MPRSSKARSSRSISDGMEIGSPPGLDGIGDFLQAVAGYDGHDRRVLRQDALLAQLLHTGRAGHTGGLAEHAAGAAEQLLRRHDLGVGDIHDQGRSTRGWP